MQPFFLPVGQQGLESASALHCRSQTLDHWRGLGTQAAPDVKRFRGLLYQHTEAIGGFAALFSGPGHKRRLSISIQHVIAEAAG